MIISEMIAKTKALYKGGSYLGVTFDEKTTRDKVLYGQEWLNRPCTGIITTCWASVDVIKEAIHQGANLIITHEAIFWNHGDHREWLIDNQTYQAKKELLDKHQIVIWRNHDYVHSGMRQTDGSYVDGILHGFVKEMGWENAISDLTKYPIVFRFSEPKTLNQLTREMVEKLGIEGLRYVGKPDEPIKTLAIGLHALGNDNNLITLLNQEGIDALLLMEMVEFTVLEFVHDCLSVGRQKAIISPGHFSLEDPGMKHMVAYLKENLDFEGSIQHVPSGRMVSYQVVEDGK
ncbi:Nif3-like dinuclear metal center hexameric protein [Streptococcus zalophi]|uniref:GTP cyclohydrolase 1 type 2 homolog n=1 Tax=Streptococcus zalophi TaxID=640031 RepID=A0A934UCS4_9STRE|nr:Nif3-like dinuclear metal center hexameric protein [Streptococcus zalophi]MBJ8349112.1 Nif3-like dinuclear metal center hexameric protein [Streptococcus zalophi]MCR8967737.1 Nif3-like dinuclear metal center hexameric protein [Streptococcus zalophi]